MAKSGLRDELYNAISLPLILYVRFGSDLRRLNEKKLRGYLEA